MNKFRLIESDVCIEINGVMLTSDATLAEVNVASARKELLDFAKRIQDGEATDGEIKKTLQSVCGKIDGAFGKGSVKSIFGEAKISLTNCLNLVEFIISQLNSFEQTVKSSVEAYRK